MKEPHIQNASRSFQNSRKAIALVLFIVAACSEDRPTLTAPAPETPSKPEGGTVTITPKQNQGGGKPGIENITVNLDGDRINRVNQRRDPIYLHKFPDLFGKKKDFAPLMTIDATGPGIIWIGGDNITGNISVPIKAGPQSVEIYPHFQLASLFQGTSGDKENLSIFFESGGKASLIDTFPATWSGPDEIFLTNNNIHDIASIVENQPVKPNTTKPELQDWIQKTCEKIIALRIEYNNDGIGEKKGWQHIRNKDEILQTRKANCLDAAVLFASLAEGAGFNAFIMTTEGHALIGVSKKHDLGSAIYIEGTALLFQKGKPAPNTEAALRLGKKFIDSEFKKNPEKIFALDLPEWEIIYRDNPLKLTQ